MASLTIRNLSTTPLELTLVERFEASPTRAAARRGVSGAVWGLLQLPSTLVASGVGSCVPDAAAATTKLGGDDGLVPRPGEGPFARDEITDVCVGPFETCLTYIRAADPNREVLRLTFAAQIDCGSTDISSQPRTYHRDHRSQEGRQQQQEQQEQAKGTIIRHYTVDIPAASPRSIELRPVDGERGRPRPGDPSSVDGTTPTPADTAAFTAVYSSHGAHLAIMSSAKLASWMATVDGAWPLSSLSLPGTHNSPACYVAMPSVRCQAVGVPTQLANGVRFLDVRVQVRPHAQPHADPRMALVHAAFPVSVAGPVWFADLYASVCAFLDEHPTETVLMSIKREGTGRGTDADLARNLLGCYVGRPDRAAAASDSSRSRSQHHPRPPRSSHSAESDDSASSSSSSTAVSSSFPLRPEPRRWFTEPRIPSLDEVRGRIVLVRRFCLPIDDADFCQPDGSPGWGIDGSDWPNNCADGIAAAGRLRLQDFYAVNVASNIQRKIEYARAQLERAASQHFPQLKKINSAAAAASAASSCPPLFINFLSGSNFFNKSCWPERIAARVNPAVIEYLCMRHGAAAKGPASLDVGDGSTGVVVTDWVGLNGDWDLIRCIVAWNARLKLERQELDVQP